MKRLRDQKIDYCEATHGAEEEWREKVTELSDKTLFPQTKSWYMGDNIPGKLREQLNFAGKTYVELHSRQTLTPHQEASRFIGS
jgi:hypothetical protein